MRKSVLIIAALVLALCLGMGGVGRAAVTTFTEDFDTFTVGQGVGDNAEWWSGSDTGGTAGPDIEATGGVGDSQCWGTSGTPATWTAHTFDWSGADFNSYTVGADFRTDGSGKYDDSRVGFSINNPSTSSSDVMSIQMDNGGTGPAGQNIEGYYDGAGAADKRPSIVDLPILSADTWYRLSAVYTKTAISNEPIIDVKLESIDQTTGAVTGVVVSGSLDTGTLAAGDEPNTKYFTSGLNPAYKNYTSSNKLDNALAIIDDDSPPPPEPLPTETLIPVGADWQYLDNGSDQGTAWKEKLFDDSGWAAGPAELGYGDGDEATVVSFGPDGNNKYPTTYFRHTFNVDDASEVAELDLDLKRDDGAVVYLNGTEVARDSVDAGQNYLTYANAITDDWISFDLLAHVGLLVDGPNVLAVEIHQQGPSSSDISMDAELIAGISAGEPGPIIPEPAGLGLIGLALLVVRRRRS